MHLPITQRTKYSLANMTTFEICTTKYALANIPAYKICTCQYHNQINMHLPIWQHTKYALANMATYKISTCQYGNLHKMHWSISQPTKRYTGQYDKIQNMHLPITQNTKICTCQSRNKQKYALANLTTYKNIHLPISQPTSAAFKCILVPLERYRKPKKMHPKSSCNTFLMYISRKN